MRRIGEEVPEDPGPDGSGRVLREFDISTTSYHIIMSRMKMVCLGSGAAFLFLIIFLVGPMLLIDPMELFGFIGIILIAIPVVFGFMIGLMALMMVPIARSILKGNKVFLKDEGILVRHQYWITTAQMTNLIPFEKISRVKRADDEYFRQVRDAVPAWKRVLLMGTPPPAGGLYHMYSNKEGLVILFLDKPLTVNNMVWGKGGGGVPRSENRTVKEVIVDIHPEDQDLFINEVKRRSSEGRKPRVVPPPPKE